MVKKFNISLFIFRRDLRLEDNTALLLASQESETIIPCFILDPRQIEETNAYRSLNAIQFMKEAILDLSENLKKFEGKLYLFQGTSEEVLTKIIQSVKINAVYTNRDYTPFSGLRDQALKKICYEHGIEFIQKNDLLLHEPEEIITGNGTPYSIFTPFFKRAGQMPVSLPHRSVIFNWYTKPIAVTLKNINNSIEAYDNEHLIVHGTV